ncbi:MAG: signal peptidase II, partial [bacterium]
VGTDFLSKELIKRKYEINEEVKIYKSLYVKHIKNNGLAMGFLSKFQNAIYIMMLSSLMLFTFLFGKGFEKNSKIKNIGYSFVLSGGLGNFIDRFFNKNITDFIYVKIDKRFKDKKINVPIFNIADIFILAGSVLMAVGEIVMQIKGLFNKK